MSKDRLESHQVWRVFVPLVPYAVLLVVLYVALRRYGLAWLAWLIVGVLMGGVLLYAWFCRRRYKR